MRRLFALPGFGRLAAAYGLNQLAWFVGTVALSVLVYRRTGSALGSAGFFLCSQAVPALFAPVVVGRLDRSSPRVLLPGLYWLEGALFGILAWLTSRFLLAPVLVLVVVDGVVSLVAGALAAAARTELVKPVDMVREGGAVTSMLFSAAYLVGPILGGLMTAVGGTVAALLVNCGLFGAMGFALLSSSIPGQIVHEGPERGRLRAALVYAFSDRPVATVLALQAVVIMFFTIPAPIEVVFAVHTLHAGSTGYGALLSVWGGGAVAGSLAYARWRRGSARALLTGSIAVTGVGFAVMSIAPVLGVGLAGAAVAGAGNGLGVAAFITEIQYIIPQSWVALLTSLNQAVSQLSPGVGIALGGLLTAIVSVRFAFGFAAVGCLAFAGVAVVVLAPARLARPSGPAGEDPPSGPAPSPDSHAGTLA
jgi:hypothetical protein